MFFKNWMSYIKPETRLRDLVLPGAHNAGSADMGKMAKCQNASIFRQYAHGVRFFCIRLSTDRKGVIRLAHGLTLGAPFTDCLEEIAAVLRDADKNEFFIFDIREYYDQKFGPITVKYKADPEKVNAAVEKYLAPAKYARTGFDIAALTLEEARADSKRYILLNEHERYRYSSNCGFIRPWQKEIYGKRAENFVRLVPELLKEKENAGLIWCELQQTPNPGTEIGIQSPAKLEKRLQPHFFTLIEGIRKDPAALANANILCGDFMTDGYYKSAGALSLNLDKDNVQPDRLGEFRAALDAHKES